MRVRMITGRTDTGPGGVTISYQPGLVYAVDEATALDWIKEGIAEDESGVVTRASLLPVEEPMEGEVTGDGTDGPADSTDSPQW